MLDTRFYGMPVEIYKKYFLECYKEVDDSSKKYMESVFFDCVMKNDIRVGKMFYYPRVLGCSGSTGGSYNDNSFKVFVKGIMNGLGFYCPNYK